MNLLFGHLILNPKQGEQIKRTLVYRRNITSAQSEYVLLSCEIPTNNLLSAYKKTETTTTLSEFCWNNKDAADYYSILAVVLSSVNKCKLLKNGKAPKKSKIQVESRATANGNVLVYTGTVKSYTFTVMKSQIADVIYSVTISGSDGLELTLQTGLLKGNAEGEAKLHAIIDSMQFVNTNSIDKTKITDIGEIKSEEEDLMSRHVKTIEEIALTKDVTWLKNKKYYVIKDERTAEQIFRTLEQYEGLISYDVETTGLNMNMYCEIGSPLKKQLEDYNASVEKELRIKADSLTGFSFCVQPNIAYYFPCGHRKFKNLYSDKNEEVTRNICNVIKNRYLFGDLRDDDSYIADYIRNTPYEEWTSDVILMERVRDILEKHKILAHHGSFEYKVDLCYHIDTNLVEDTMILHQLAFKWKNVRTHAGEPSNLKYLTKTVLGCDQLSLEDFFSGFVEAETAGEVRTASMTAKKKSKKKKILIDFSYMDEEGTRCYAPADVDFTLQLWNIFKVDMNTQFKDLDYLYGVEIILACAIGYAEFYGLHINESKINNAKYESLVKMADMEHKVRSYNNLCDEEENKAFEDLMVLWENKDTSHDVLEIALTRLSEIVEKRGNLNLGSPGQVGQLLYTKYNWKTDEDGKMSMGKKVIKQYEKLTDEEGKPLYPEVIWYRQWKDESTLITKFFDKLQDFMYPGGNIFTSFGQIACATGRMSSKKPNFQQMPGSITKIIEPREGYVFFDGDFSQIEYRCLCALANERSLIEAFKDPDMDYHQKMASLMYDVPYALVPDALRKSAKTFNFGIPYGMGFASLAIQLHGNKNKSSVEDAKEKYELYFKEQPKVRQFFVDVKEAAQYNEYTKTYFGRRRYFKFTDETGNLNQSFVASALRQAGNAVIQGCLSGETLINTKEYGIVKIKDVVGQKLHVWNGTNWTLGDIMSSGYKRKCVVKFNNGQEFICSPDHKFLVRSKRGTERFVRCEDLVTSELNRINPHRVVVNTNYTPSDYKYSSDWAKVYWSTIGNANNALLEDVGDSFKQGVILGRLASDGSIVLREQGGNYVLHYVAEHEKEVGQVLNEYMSNLNCTYIEKDVRPGRSQTVDWVRVMSSSLTNEINELNIKQDIDSRIFRDTEMLRGFLRGLFDGDDGVSGKTITLVFGKQDNFEAYSHNIQKALQFFGIRSHVRSYEGDRTVVVIKTQDNDKFLETIGFINKEKQEKGLALKAKLDEHTFGKVLIPEYIDITDESIPMYDVCNTECGYYVADGIITHNTARDIFGIAAARAFMNIRANHLIGKVRMCNFIHDEVLYEISARLNPISVVGMILESMQLNIPGFPPLYVGGGIGNAWKTAKGSMNEIHPTLGLQMIEEAHNNVMPEGLDGTAESIYKYFENRVYTFRKEKIAAYVANVEYLLRTNQTFDAIDPAIGKLLGLQFEGGVDEKVKQHIKEYKEHCALKGIEPDDKRLQAFKEQIVPLRLKTFIFDFADTVKAELIKIGAQITEDTDLNNLLFVQQLNNTIGNSYEEDEEQIAYDDGDEDEYDDLEDYEFELINESNELYGVSIIDIAKQFGLAIIPSKKICCIYIGNKTQKQIEHLATLFDKHQCDEDDEGAMKVELVRADNYVLRPDIYVNNISSDMVQEELLVT